jgi:hypothetical protein
MRCTEKTPLRLLYQRCRWPWRPPVGPSSTQSTWSHTAQFSSRALRTPGLTNMLRRWERACRNSYRMVAISETISRMAPSSSPPILSLSERAPCRAPGFAPPIHPPNLTHERARFRRASEGRWSRRLGECLYRPCGARTLGEWGEVGVRNGWVRGTVLGVPRGRRRERCKARGLRRSGSPAVSRAPGPTRLPEPVNSTLGRLIQVVCTFGMFVAVASSSWAVGRRPALSHTGTPPVVLRAKCS